MNIAKMRRHSDYDRVISNNVLENLVGLAYEEKRCL